MAEGAGEGGREQERGEGSRRRERMKEVRLRGGAREEGQSRHASLRVRASPGAPGGSQPAAAAGARDAPMAAANLRRRGLNTRARIGENSRVDGRGLFAFEVL